MNTEELTRIVVEALEDVKAKDIKVFNTEKLTDQFERVVIASAATGNSLKKNSNINVSCSLHSVFRCIHNSPVKKECQEKIMFYF